jgi:hypothetical protein
MIGWMMGAFGADDVARLRLVFRKRRFQMIDDRPPSWSAKLSSIFVPTASLSLQFAEAGNSSNREKIPESQY